jgi:hypothetical protein
MILRRLLMRSSVASRRDQDDLTVQPASGRACDLYRLLAKTFYGVASPILSSMSAPSFHLA